MDWDPLWMIKRLAPAALLVVFWLWESWAPFVGQLQGRMRHALGNLALALGNTLALALLFGVATVTLAQWTEHQGWGLLSWLGCQGPVRVGLALVLLDGWMYLWHRANHALPWLWHFHRLHHSDRHMDVTTATRFHPGEQVAGALLRLPLIPLLGLDLWLLVAYETVVVAVTQMHHADISLGRWDPWLRWALVTPDLHKVHHSQEPEEHDANFSTVLSVWDWLGGTLRSCADLPHLQFGLREEKSPGTLVRGLWGWISFRRPSAG